MHVGCSDEVIQPLGNIFHCKQGKQPRSYLGLPIWAKSRSKVVWVIVLLSKNYSCGRRTIYLLEEGLR